MQYNFSVEPMEYVRGYCPTKCETLESALEQYEFLEENTPLCWAIVPLNEQAEQELDNYYNSAE